MEFPETSTIATGTFREESLNMGLNDEVAYWRNMAEESKQREEADMDGQSITEFSSTSAVDTIDFTFQNINLGGLPQTPVRTKSGRNCKCCYLC